MMGGMGNMMGDVTDLIDVFLAAMIIGLLTVLAMVTGVSSGAIRRSR